MKITQISLSKTSIFLGSLLMICGVLFILYLTIFNIGLVNGSLTPMLSLVGFSLFLVSFPTFYIFEQRKYLKQGGFKYLFVEHPQEIDDRKNALELAKKKTEENEQKRKEATERKAMEKELNRKGIEKYKITKIGGGWTVVPFIISLVALGFGIYALLNSMWGYTILSFIVACIPMFLDSVSDDWYKALQFKEEVKQKFPNYQIPNYEYGYLYSDSNLEYLAYNLSKIYCYLATVAGVVIAAILLFTWLGSIAIAPTTIIIILLVILILK